MFYYMKTVAVPYSRGTQAAIAVGAGLLFRLKLGTFPEIPDKVESSGRNRSDMRLAGHNLL